MFIAALLPVILGATAALAVAKPTRTSLLPRQATGAANISFVSTQDGRFTVKGSPLEFVGTNAYWLHTLDAEDIDRTLGNISASGVKVVRTWAFNDVTAIPENGTWFQLIHPNGTATINEGPNGLQKLDKVVEFAEKHDLYVLFAFTNNWNPDPAFDDIEVGAGPVRRSDIVSRNNNGQSNPRNTLSNDYGGMDTYVRQLGLQSHDEFYTNATIINLFKNYTATIAKRYADSPRVFAWELANDPRCNSTLPASNCSPKAVTRWHASLAEHVKTVDTNHLVSSGNGGHFCVECPKLFDRPAPPPPLVSPAANGGLRRRSSPYLTKREIIQDRLTTLKRNRARNLKRGQSGGGIMIRGRWSSTPTRRQAATELGPTYDGSFGVDSEDILNIPDVSFGSFQLFPDQNNYGPADPNLTPFENFVEQGSTWIRRQAEAASAAGKPSVLSGFGLVTQPNAPFFVPFNSSEAPFAADAGTPVSEQPYGVTLEERDQAFTTWLNVGLVSGLKSMIHYQWGQDNLTVSPGTPVSVAPPGTGLSEEDGVTGISPNDGYSTNGAGRQEVIDVLQEGAQQFASDSLLRR